VNSIYQSPANDLESKIFDRLDDATVAVAYAVQTAVNGGSELLILVSGEQLTAMTSVRGPEE
jgi:hypothetical protein